MTQTGQEMFADKDSHRHVCGDVPAAHLGSRRSKTFLPCIAEEKTIVACCSKRLRTSNAGVGKADAKAQWLYARGSAAADLQQSSFAGMLLLRILGPDVARHSCPAS